jgi:hypothetical protein
MTEARIIAHEAFIPVARASDDGEQVGRQKLDGEKRFGLPLSGLIVAPRVGVVAARPPIYERVEISGVGHFVKIVVGVSPVPLGAAQAPQIELRVESQQQDGQRGQSAEAQAEWKRCL